MKNGLLIFYLLYIVQYAHAQEKVDTNKIQLKKVRIGQSIGGKSENFQLTGSGHYLDIEEIQKLKQTDVNRMLKQIPGVNIQEEDGFGLRPNIGLRGVSSDRSSKITVMEDGILMAPASYAAPGAYYFPLAARMSAIEVLKGSSQIKFGPNTNGGVINLISTPISDSYNAFIKTTAGNFGNRGLHAYASGKYKRIGFLIESFQAKSNGFKQLPNQQNTGFGIQDYLLKLSYESKADSRYFHRLSLKIAENSQRANETYLGISKEDFIINPYQRYQASQLDNIDLKQRQYVLSHQMEFNKNLSLTTDIYRTDFDRNWYKLDKVFDTLGKGQALGNILTNDLQPYLDILRGNGQGELDIKANNRTYYAQGVQTSLNGKYERSNATHSFSIGLRIHQDAADRFQWVDQYTMNGTLMSLKTAGIAGTESNRIEKADAMATYAQYQLELGKWKIIPGLRYENICFEKQDFGTTDLERVGNDQKITRTENKIFLPGLGLSYIPNDYWVLIAGAHRGFSPAGFSPNALPESSNNYEAGFRYQHSSTKASAILYYSSYDNLLGADNVSVGGTGSGEQYNGGAARAYGAELMVAHNIIQELSDKFALPIGINYTYTKAQFFTGFDSEFDAWGQVNALDDIPYIPNHQFGATVTFVHEAFNFHYNYKWQSAMMAVAGLISQGGNNMIPAFSTSDISLSYDINQKVQVFANLLNVFNQKNIVAMRPAGLRPNLPRNINFGIQVRL